MNTDLRTRRQVTGLSQQKLAELASCSVGMVRMLESGLRPEQSDVLPRIEKVLADHAAQPDANAPGSDAPGRKAAA